MPAQQTLGMEVLERPGCDAGRNGSSSIQRPLQNLAGTRWGGGVTKRLGGLKVTDTGLLCRECYFNERTLNLKATNYHTSSKMEV